MVKRLRIVLDKRLGPIKNTVFFLISGKMTSFSNLNYANFFIAHFQGNIMVL